MTPDENQIKVLSKGYTIEVTSWENDADNYDTRNMTFDSKEYALAVLHLCETVFVSCNNGDGGIGNMTDMNNDNVSDIIEKYIEKNPFLGKDEDYIIDFVMDINYDLMGVSEYYFSRVFESAILYYSPEDVYAEKVKA